MNWLLLAVAWIVFYALHSVLASNTVKAKLGQSQRSYRLFYNFFALASFSLVLFVHTRVPSTALFSKHPITDAIGVGLILAGLWTHFLTFRQLSVRAFLGIDAEVQGNLVAKGIYAHLRHPIYLGVLLIMSGLLLFQPTIPVLVGLLVTIAYLPFGIYFEEQKLIAEFGNTYKLYRTEVPSVFPKF